MPRFREFARSDAGSVAVIFALAAVVLFGITAIGIEVGRANRVKTILQNAGDAAAIAGARELSMAGSDSTIIAGIANGSVKRFVEANSDNVAKVSSDTVVTTTPLEVRVKVVANLDLPFGAVIGQSSVVISSESVARVIGQPNLCVLGLDPAAAGTISLGAGSNVTGKNCSVFSNSTSISAITSSSTGVLKASTICSAGGISGSPGNFLPRAITDCPTFKDPLSDRAAPEAGACTHYGKKIKGGSITLTPGVYCGGLVIGSQADVTMTPGIYVIRDGAFDVGTKATVRGTGVGIYFEGATGSIRFRNDSNIELRAPTSGPMAGILFFGDRKQPTTTTYVINSENARVLVGTIYLPTATLLIDSPKVVGDLSEYTAIVARVVDFRQGIVVLNTDYGLTDVPVPPAIKGAGQPVALSH